MTNIEFEGKILDVEPSALIKKITAAGGKLQGEYHFRRYVFDTLPARKGAWLRLRTNGKLTTLTLKEIQNDSISGTKEWEIEVSDFETTLEILKKAGFRSKGYQENKRLEYELDATVLAIDTWPLVPTYLEIEGPDEQSVRATAKLLGYAPSELIGDNTDKVYARYGIDINKIKRLKF